MIGKTISHYKILEKLGEGGMGVVYKAEDTKLKRTVALKFLPLDVASNDELRKRFINEAQTASALNHPNICTIHAVEDNEEQSFISMEFVAGKELREIVGSEDFHPLPTEQIVDYATQIAEGLQAAHKKGIVHRDIKPANIMVTDDGLLKVMDFGLAKKKGQAALTKTGSTLGTVAYMSPEQARNEPVDHRSDIFSFGAVLYELCSGRQPFEGDYEAATLYSVVHEPPETLPDSVPSELQSVVFKCLEKEVANRYESAEPLLAALREINSGTDSRTQPATTTKKQKSGNRTMVMLAGAVIVLLAYIAVQWGGLFKPDRSIPRLTNPTKVTHAIGVENYPTWSPDGSKIAYASNQSGKWDIWMKQLSGGEPINMTKGTAMACLWPRWSPAGSQIAFFSWQDLWSLWFMPAIGGTPNKVASRVRQSHPVWSPDGTQLAYVRRDSTGLPGAEIYTLSTYQKRKVALPGEQFERLYLSWSPDGDFFAYTDGDNIYAGADISAIKIVRITDGTDYQIPNATSLDFFPIWSLDGRLLYFISDRGGTTDLWQVKTNADGSLDGHPEQISHGLGLQSLAFSPNGTKIAFSKENRAQNLWRIPIPKLGVPATQWTDAQQLTFESSTIGSVDISPDGKQVYFDSNRSGNWDIWSMPATGGVLRQLSSAREDEGSIGLSPDGKTMAFVSERSGKREIWTMPAIGGPARQVTNHRSTKYNPRWSPDGQTIAFEASDSTSNTNLWIVSAKGGEPRQITTAGFLFYLSWWPDGLSLVSIGQVNHWGLWRFPIDGGDPDSLTAPEFRDVKGDAHRWSSDKTQIYFIRYFDDAENIWSLSVEEGTVRQLTNFSGRYGSLGRSFTTDGSHFYFTWLEHTGDIWVMDVEHED